MSSVQSIHSTDAYTTAKQEVDRLFEVKDLELHRDQIQVSTVAWKKRLGVCKYNKSITGTRRFGNRMTGTRYSEGTHIICIDRNIETKADFLDTVRHELAHAEAYERYGSSQKHNHNWKAIAMELGAKPTRCGSGKKEPDYKYYISCPECERSWGKHRICKTVKKPQLYRCPDCEESCVSHKAGDPIPTNPGTSTIPRVS